MDLTTSKKAGNSNSRDVTNDRHCTRCLNVAETVRTDTNMENITSWTETVPLECTQESPIVTDVKATVNVTCVKSSLQKVSTWLYS